jgi:GNAT superfamily N-acetyltransferase
MSQRQPLGPPPSPKTYTITELAPDRLDFPLARCAFRVWEETSRRLGIVPSPQAILDELRKFWLKQDTPLLIVARLVSGDIVGFRFGHALRPIANERIFYDENGGVDPAYRRQGIGRALVREQHRLAKALGFSRIRTKTALDLKAMIILNLQEGFDIVGLETEKGEGWQAKALTFEKTL